jgi:hypothetical protein
MSGPDDKAWYAPNWSEADRYDAKSMRGRLEMRSVIYLGQPDRQRVAMDMQRQGEVVCSLGSGPDQGLLLVRRATVKFRPFGGGRVA